MAPQHLFSSSSIIVYDDGNVTRDQRVKAYPKVEVCHQFRSSSAWLAVWEKLAPPIGLEGTLIGLII